MHRPLQFLLQHLIQPLMTLHLAQSAESVCHHHQFEMRVRARSGVLMAFVLKLQQRRLQFRADFLFDGGSNSHGDTND